MTSSMYQEPNVLRQPRGVGLVTTWKLVDAPCRKVVMVEKVACPRRRDAASSLSRRRWNQIPMLIWCLPLFILTPSEKVMRLRRLETPAAGLEPPAVMAPAAVVVTPPPIEI